MTNKYDRPWHFFKQTYSDKIGDITSLWNCGVKERDIAFSKGIFSWKDARFNSKLIGFNGIKGEILDGILKVNQDPHAKIYTPNIKPLIDFLNYKDYPVEHAKNKLEFFVDFETVNDLDDNFDKMPYSNGYDRVFMIGLGWISPESNEWKYKSFIVDSLDEESEKENFIHWLKYMRYIKNFTIGKEHQNPRVYHWGHAEQTWFKKSFNRLGLPEVYKNIEWVDLLKNVKKNPIFVKNSLNFGLKGFSRALHKHGFIKTDWEDNQMDGVGAMVSAWKANEKAKMNEISFKQMPIIREITRYNEVDCKVMMEIIKFIRKLKR